MERIKIPWVDDSKYPVKLGPDPRYAILRSPNISYPMWGVEGPDDVLMPLSRQQYAAEWEKGGPNQMQMVRDAAKESLGDCPGMLYNANKEIMLAITRYWLDLVKKVKITEPGFGRSTVEMYRHFLENNIDPDRVFVTGIEPSQRRIDSAVSELKQMDIKEGKHFIALNGTDIQHLPYVEGQHAIAYVATKHHDAYSDTAFQLSNRALVGGGFLVDSDWFERMCMYPSLVLQFYQDLNANDLGWETKDEDIENFRKIFPNTGYFPELNPSADMAVKMIQRFWEKYAEIRTRKIRNGEFDFNDEYFLQEAHGHPEVYMDMMLRAGFRLDSKGIDKIVKESRLDGNPHRITNKKAMLEIGMDSFFDYMPEEGSELLTAIIAQNTD